MRFPTLLLVVFLVACTGISDVPIFDPNDPTARMPPVYKPPQPQQVACSQVVGPWPKIEPQSTFRRIVLARRAWTWSVVVEFDLNGTGVPQSPRILESQPAPDLNEYVLETVRKARYKEGTIATGCIYQYMMGSTQRAL
jgi:TonB family protein